MQIANWKLGMNWQCLCKGTPSSGLTVYCKMLVFNKNQVNVFNWQVSFAAYNVKNQKFQRIVYIEIHSIGS